MNSWGGPIIGPELSSGSRELADNSARLGAKSLGDLMSYDSVAWSQAHFAAQALKRHLAR
jgi:hypothetical protein